MELLNLPNDAEDMCFEIVDENVISFPDIAYQSNRSARLKNFVQLKKKSYRVNNQKNTMVQL